MQTVQAAVLNAGPYGARGFDAFSGECSPCAWALADGANSCPGAGVASAWLVHEVALALESVDTARGVEATVMALHQRMRDEHPDTASTLLLMRRLKHSVLLASVGDSRLQFFRAQGWPRKAWGEAIMMPVDVDAQGHPSQMVGSDVCEAVHVQEVGLRGCSLLVMASDGVSRMVDRQEVGRMVQVIGRARPSREDLQYLCEAVVRLALDRGGDDDASVAMVWSSAA
jgi:serine/threonine protein phosphatase PrpC